MRWEVGRVGVFIRREGRGRSQDKEILTQVFENIEFNRIGLAEG